jgi:hypothetical protein
MSGLGDGLGGPVPSMGGLARVLARAALPPVSVPSAYAGEPRAVVRPETLGLTNDTLSPAPPGRIPSGPTVPDSRPEPGDATPPPSATARPPATVMPLRPPPADPTEGTGRAPSPGTPPDPALPPHPTRVAGPALDDRQEVITAPVARPPAQPPKSVPAPLVAASGTPGRIDPPPAQSPIAPVDAVPQQDPVGAPQPVLTAPRTVLHTPAAPDRGEPPTPAAFTPPVVIGRIEVHVDSPAAQPDPFAGCRVVVAGLTARRGGGW